VDWTGTEALEELMAGGGMMPAQLPVGCFWSPEKRLAGAVLAAALIEIRDHHADPKYHRLISEDLVWLRSNDGRDPYSFIRLCQLLNIEPVWVRETVHRWMASVTPLATVPRRRRVRGPKAELRTTDQTRTQLDD
jgi:hypothetical protein